MSKKAKEYTEIFSLLRIPELSIISEQKFDIFAHCAIALCSPMLRKRLLTTSTIS